MATLKQIYKTEDENGNWVVNEEITECCRKTATEEDRSYPGYGCDTHIHYKSAVVGNELIIYCVPQDDPRLEEVMVVFYEMLFDTGRTEIDWQPEIKYLEGKVCQAGGSKFTMGKEIRRCSVLEVIKDQPQDFDPQPFGSFASCII